MRIVFGKNKGKCAAPRRTEHQNRSLRLEALEKRQMLSFSPILIEDINSYGVSCIAETIPDDFWYRHEDNIEDLLCLSNVNGTLYFNADDGKSGVELWKTDGTEEGTTLVKDIVTDDAPTYPSDHWGSGPSFPRDFIDVNGTLFFIADEPGEIYESRVARCLWKSDGTEEGTVMVKRFGYAVHEGDTLDLLANVDGILFFQNEYQLSALSE